MTKKFLRQDFMMHIKIGKHRKKIQKWRRPKGRDSKMRLKMKGYPASPGVGYKALKKDKGKIKGFKSVIVHNVSGLAKLDNNSIIIIAKKVGARNKINIIKKAEEMKLPILNVKRIKQGGKGDGSN